MRHLLTRDAGYWTGAFLVWAFLLPALARESISTRLDFLMENRLYARALDEVDLALKQPHDKAEDATLSLYKGSILFKLQRENAACEVFLKVLAQKPDAVLPLKLRSEFQQKLEDLRPEIKIRQLQESLQYEAELNEVSARSLKKQGQDEEERISLYKGIILYELIRQGEGREIFRGVLRRNMNAQLPLEDVSPKIKDDFNLIREQLRSEDTRPGGVRRYAWIPAVAGGAVAVAGGGLALSATQDDQVRRAVGVTLVCMGVASVLTAVGIYALAPSQSTHPSISVGTNGASAFVSVSMKWP